MFWNIWHPAKAESNIVCNRQETTSRTRRTSSNCTGRAIRTLSHLLIYVTLRCHWCLRPLQQKRIKFQLGLLLALLSMHVLALQLSFIWSDLHVASSPKHCLQSEQHQNSKHGRNMQCTGYDMTILYNTNTRIYTFTIIYCINSIYTVLSKEV